uniref:Uncharacterized protein n=1 Tax=Tetraselmis sp. GSL018 TaxID=582737 RepID=A0A061RL76_9CHLO
MQHITPPCGPRISLGNPRAFPPHAYSASFPSPSEAKAA